MFGEQAIRAGKTQKQAQMCIIIHLCAVRLKHQRVATPRLKVGDGQFSTASLSPPRRPALQGFPAGFSRGESNSHHAFNDMSDLKMQLELERTGRTVSAIVQLLHEEANAKP